MPGVERRRLDRVQGDPERVTTIVRYAPGSQFSAHTHPLGEEFIVMEGVFEDDYGNWPAGSYIRNPPQSRHTPGSKDGCTILVKLCQFQPDDRTMIHADINKIGRVADRYRDGVTISTLYKDPYEEVRVEYWDSNATINLEADDGAELFVLRGGFKNNKDTLSKYSWMRVPLSSTVIANTSDTGAVVWIKTGHLIDYQ